MVILRELNITDATLMYEWMQDIEVTKWFKQPFSTYTYDNCCKFIENTRKEKNTKHYAISNENMDYLGTISLKNINKGSSELSIVLRRSVQSKGIGTKAINMIFDIGFIDMGLDFIYLNVIKDNENAIKCYEKNGFIEIEHNVLCKTIGIEKEANDNELKWYIKYNDKRK